MIYYRLHMPQPLLRVAATIAALGGSLVAAPASAQQMTVEPDGAACGEYGDWDHQRERYCEVRTMLVAASPDLDIDARPNGGIRIDAWDRDEVEVVAIVQAQARRRDDAQSLVQDVEVRVSGGRIEADGPRGLDRGDHWSVSYRIRVPRRTDLDLRALNGGISVTGVEGRMDLRTVNGGLSLAEVAGDVRGRSTNGGITARLGGRSWQGAGLDLETTNGGVDLALPAGYSARLETGSVHGGYDIDFPVTVEGRVNPRRLAVDIGDGGPTIRAITTNGGVRVRRS